MGQDTHTHRASINQKNRTPTVSGWTFKTYQVTKQEVTEYVKGLSYALVVSLKKWAKIKQKGVDQK
jgi:hypothetical protein